MNFASILAGLLLATGVAQGSGTKVETDFTEARKSKSENTYRDSARKSVAGEEARGLERTGTVIESARQNYLKFNNRVRVPGFISASPLPQIGRIVGPIGVTQSQRMGDTVFIRWSGAPLPKAGDRYSTFSPAVVLQNLEQPADFEVFAAPDPTTKLPKGRRLAGYFYESTGRIKVVKTKGGLVQAIVEQLSGQLGVGDELMQMPPLVENITPINSGIQLSAAVVSGSPADRLSTTRRSFLYLNRGSRDGIRVGRVFESVEAVHLDESVGGMAPELSNGEAIVIHVTDSYATAMITKQFDVIRIGSILRTKQEDSPIDPNAPFNGYVEIKADNDKSAHTTLEIPSANKLPTVSDESLPEPRKRPSGPPLSELDELERSLKTKGLTPAEKARLDKLSAQEKLGDKTEVGDDLSDIPGSPTVENSFKEGKKTAKKDTKKKTKKSKNDEEELNLLMMQN
ncbi:MAG: hypothetical protein ACXVB9_16135 [Bdellovibrionota bacterium]